MIRRVPPVARGALSLALLLLACLSSPRVAAADHDVIVARRASPHVAWIEPIRQARAGQPVRLRAGDGMEGRPFFTWQLTRRPEASLASIAQPTAGETSFFADVPGRYEVRLSVRVGTQVESTTLAVSVIDPYHPLIPINTIDIDAFGPGILIGSQRYVAPGNAAAGLHVLILERETLELSSSQSMSANSTVALDSNSLSALANGLSLLPNSKLVIVSLPASAGTFDGNAMDAVLAKIGGVMPKFWLSQLPHCWASNQAGCVETVGTVQPWSRAGQATHTGSFSVIGVPGLSPGKAWFDSAEQRGTVDGPLVGYLQPGTDVSTPSNTTYSFVFTPDQYVPVDTCASGGPSACVIAVGTQRFAPDPGVDGLNVVVLDRVTLAPLLHQTMVNTAALSGALYTGLPGKTGKYVLFSPQFFSDRRIVLIQTVGGGKLAVNLPDYVSPLIDQLGGTPETFGEAVNKGLPYALIGVATKLPWHGTGIESSTFMDPSLPGRARGVLSRDRMARYTPTANDPTGLANLELFEILYQAPTPWPYEGSCALEYLANSLGLYDYPDIRSAYNAGVLVDQKRPKDVPYPNPLPAYCATFPSPDEFAAIQQRLADEFSYVGAVRTLMANLKAPYTDTQLSLETIVTDVRNDLADSVTPPPTPKSALPWLNVFKGIMPLASKLSPSVGTAMGMVVAVGTVAESTVLSAGTSPYGSGAAVEQLYAEADQLVSTLQAQYEAHIASLGYIEQILLTDSGKLETVGQKLFGSAAWSWSSTATSKASYLVDRNTRSAVYAALLPATWPLYVLKPDLSTQFRSDSVQDFGCGWDDTHGETGLSYPFRPAQVSNQFLSRVQVLPDKETSTNEVWTFAKLYQYFQEATYYDNSIPTQQLTTYLFSTDANGAAVYAPSFYRTTYNPPSTVTCGTSNHKSSQHAPYVIGPPEAAYTEG